ncbi:MAG TPA: hypothetical protein PKE64_22195 [Anaerolineae bacterium]|nr:hypothetical protein [Anaerolineae bacterium]HMR66732.1 hypothetical protein [Anaerolineae bacterium]
MELKDLQHWTRLDLSGNVENLEYYVSEGMDYLALLRFKITADHLNDLTTALGFTKPLRQNYQPFPVQLSEAPSWWQPQNAQRFIGGSVLVPGLSRELLVDQTSPQAYTVYLRTYQVG